MLGLSKSLERIDKVLEDLSRIELKDLIKDVEKWLIPDVDVGQQHQAKRPKLASGYDKARSWLLDSPEFKSWEEGDEGAEQFWINGAVGTGKSSLVAILPSSWTVCELKTTSPSTTAPSTPSAQQLCRKASTTQQLPKSSAGSWAN
jgi:hypothetical protein